MSATLIQLEKKAYKTAWQEGGTPRAAQKLSLTRAENLPDVFEFYGSLKVHQASTTAITRTLFKCGDYHCYIDSADNKVKMTNGVATATISSALTWAVTNAIHWCAGRYADGKIKVGAKVGSGTVYLGEETAAAIASGVTVYNGSNDGATNAEGVIYNFGYRYGDRVKEPATQLA